MNADEVSKILRFAIYVVGVLVIVVAMLAASYVLGQRHHETATDEVYEAGIEITGSARLRLYPRFYLVATFFVIFDLESVYLFAWAAGAIELGWAGYYEVLFFAAMLLAALIYLWRIGALNFGPIMRRPRLAAARQPVVNTERSVVEP